MALPDSYSIPWRHIRNSHGACAVISSAASEAAKDPRRSGRPCRCAGEIRWKSCENSNEYCRTEIFNLKNIWNIAVNISELEIEEETSWKHLKPPWKWKESENHMEVDLWRRLFGRFYLEDLGGLAVSGQQLVLAVAKISKNPAGLHGFDTCSRYRFMISDKSRLKSTIVCLQCGKPNKKPTIWGAFVTPHYKNWYSVEDGLWLGLPSPCHINSLQFASPGLMHREFTIAVIDRWVDTWIF